MKASVSENRKAVSVSPKVNRVNSFVIGEAAIAIIIGVAFRLMMGTDIIAGIYTDGLSLLSVIGVTFVVLAAAGLLKEFGCAFAYCVADASDTDAAQLKKAAAAVKLSMITAVLTGVLMAMIGVIGSLYSPVVEEPAYLPILLANSMIGMLYGIVAAILLLPVYARLKNWISNE